LPPSSTGSQATTSTSTPTAPGGLSRSTSVGDRRYPRLGSADIDVDHYDVALTYDNAAVSLSGRMKAVIVSVVSRTRCSAELSRSGAPLIRDRSKL